MYNKVYLYLWNDKEIDSINNCFKFLFSDKQNRELRDGILHSVALLVTSQITERVSAVMINEIPRHILPVIVTQLEKMKAQILTDVAQKLRSCDQVIKESIMNMSSSKVCIKMMGRN